MSLPITFVGKYEIVAGKSISHLHTLIFWLVCAATCQCTRISSTIHNKHKNLKPFKHLSIILEGPTHAFDLMRIRISTFSDCTLRASNENWTTLARICCDLERTAMCVPACLLGDNQSACLTVSLTAWRDCPVNCSCQHSSANWQPPSPIAICGKTSGLSWTIVPLREQIRRVRAGLDIGKLCTGYNQVKMYVTGRTKHLQHHIEYIFLINV